MNRILLCIGFQLAIAGSLVADSNLQIVDVGLNDHSATPSSVRLVIRNPSSQTRLIHLRVAASSQNGVTNTIENDVRLNGSEQREMELPILLPPGLTGLTDVVADASAGGAAFGHMIFIRDCCTSPT